MTGVPLRIVVLVAGMVLLLSQLGNVRFWRWVDDATTPGKEHAGLTRQEAVSGAKARIEGFLDAHDYPRGRIRIVRAEPISGRVQFWCKGCEHWQVELALRDDRYCIAISEEFAAFSNGCSRWHESARGPRRSSSRRPGRSRARVPQAASASCSSVGSGPRPTSTRSTSQRAVSVA